MGKAKSKPEQSAEVKLRLIEAAAQTSAVRMETNPALAAQAAGEMAGVWYSYVMGEGSGEPTK